MKNPDETRGIWGAIARTKEPRSELARALVDELNEGLQILSDVPAAVTFFGGARIARDDPYFKRAYEMGELLAERGIPPRTGAGPGIMSAVPEGFRSRLAQHGDLEAGGVERQLGKGAQPMTQGFNIVLPFEQAVNPSIDLSLELSHFPTRKLMLYQNALGLVIFPGGFGTLDELLEVWRMKVAGKLDYPVVLFGRDFWKPQAEALRAICKSCPSIAVPDESFDLLHCTDDPEEAIEWVAEVGATRCSSESLFDLGHRIARELIDGLDYLEQLAPAVTVLGGSRLEAGDDAIADAEELACALAEEGVPTRAAGSGNLSVALAVGGHRGAEHLPQQAFGMRRPDARNLYGADRVHLVADRLTHKVLLTEGSRALVALPGSLGTLDEIFSVVCQLQTRKVSNRPIILLGTDYWQPILDTLARVMLHGPRQTIGADDLDLMTITDDPREAAALALASPDILTPLKKRS